MATPERGSIFYGICGEGLGHFFRAAFLVPRLIEEGYSVELFASGRVADLCEARFPECRVHRVSGLRMHYRANRLNVPRSVLSYAGMGLRGAWSSCRVRKLANDLKPVAVISDYEPVTAWTAFALGIPAIALDHQQIATECDADMTSSSRGTGLLLRQSNRMTYLKPRTRIIVSFFHPPLRRRRQHEDVQLIAPILRPELLRRTPSKGSHVVVYQTSRTFKGLDDVLSALPGEKRVYGAGPAQSGLPEEPFSESGFLDDLASCRFAIVNGGHTTISEALYYGKPVLCFPVLGQVEQEINASYVATLGFGMDYRPESGQVPSFSEFLDRESDIRETIARATPKCGNDELCRVVLDRLDRWGRTVKS